VLAVEERDAASPAAGEVLVEVEAVGVNFIDVYQRIGAYPIPTPFVNGNEAAGRVVGVGPDVPGLGVGDRVAWAMVPGSGARFTVVPARRVVPVPDTVPLEVAAAVTLQGLTAQFLTTDTHAVTPGTVALVHAAAGGVGQLLVQMIRAKGGRVIATAGGPEKCAMVARLGVDDVIDYSAVDDLAAEVRGRTGGRGVDVAYDGVGRATFDASLDSLRPRGLLVLFGAASGPVPPFEIQRLNWGGSLFLTRPSLIHHIEDRVELDARAADVFDQVAAGTLHIEVGGRYTFAEAAAAYRALESRQTHGKLLLTPS